MQVELLKKSESSDGSIKFLWKLKENQTVESIYFPLNGKFIYCISSQVGCNVACPFCETGKQKSTHNLTPDEILGQVYGLLDAIKKPSVSEIDFAGMGEPLHNFKNVTEAATRMKEEKLTDLVSLTTSGVVPNIKLIPSTAIQELYISLHAATNDIRNKIVPLNKKYSIDELVRACAYASDRMGKKITANYLLFKDLNDSDLDMKFLSDILDPKYFRIQLSEWNNIDNTQFQVAPMERFHEFSEYLYRSGYEVFYMRSKGTSVDGGCGQLRSNFQQNQ